MNACAFSIAEDTSTYEVYDGPMGHAVYVRLAGFLLAVVETHRQARQFVVDDVRRRDSDRSHM